ncbi:MAG: 2-oxoglutarate dehydrogenase complex dihydrolipoyllysine-residue succinyltransferase [Candidatus Sedimenticola sp. 6PFRAG7]
MANEFVVPDLGESVSEATVVKWFKRVGEYVEEDESLVSLETDKVTLDVPASSSGVLKEIHAEESTDVEVGALLGIIDQNAKPATQNVNEHRGRQESSEKEKLDLPKIAKQPDIEENNVQQKDTPPAQSPSVRRILAENTINPSEVPLNERGRITKDAAIEYAESMRSVNGSSASSATSKKNVEDQLSQAVTVHQNDAKQRRVKMTRLRKRIAERLKEAQDTAAMLTTFNEVDMSGVMVLRSSLKEQFQNKHDVKLGLMSFFTKACIVALKEFPAVNAEIDGDEIVYKNHYDIGVAVGTKEGLVVPVVRDADKLSFAEIEKTISNYGSRAREGKLGLDELTGGTFTISNGGVYGSLMSTPILNPPQSGILGIHKTQKRPIVLPDDSIVVRPMTYIALSYDHRIIDGREAVSFLVRVKECLEQPSRIMLDA